MWAEMAAEFTVYKKGGRSGYTRVPDEKPLVLQVTTDPKWTR